MSAQTEINEKPSLEVYKAIAMSTGHLSESAVTVLNCAADKGDQMVWRRDVGYIVKLFDDEQANLDWYGHNEPLYTIVVWAFEHGYRMIDFDSGAGTLPFFSVYDW